MPKVPAQSRHRIMLPHEFLWDCHIYSGLCNSQHCQNQIANTKSSIHKLPLYYLFMSRKHCLEFSSKPNNNKKYHYTLKITVISLKRLNQKKKKGRNCDPARYVLSPVKVICWLAQRYQESCFKDITVLHALLWTFSSHFGLSLVISECEKFQI